MGPSRTCARSGASVTRDESAEVLGVRTVDVPAGIDAPDGTLDVVGYGWLDEGTLYRRLRSTRLRCRTAHR